MHSQVLQHWVLGFVLVATVLWLDLIPGEWLRRMGLLLLAWAAASTLLVASAGACVALIRTRQNRPTVRVRG
jgi:hypothetical protein